MYVELNKSNKILIFYFIAHPNDNNELFASTLYQAICIFCNAPSPPLPIRKLLLLLWKILLVSILKIEHKIISIDSNSLLSVVLTIHLKQKIKLVANRVLNQYLKIQRKSSHECRRFHHHQPAPNVWKYRVKTKEVAAPDVLKDR